MRHTSVLTWRKECTAMKPVPTADPTWTRVNYLRIMSANFLDSAKVFGNGKQQCEIVVGIGLLNGNVNVDISPDFAKSLIQIVNYKNPQAGIPITDTPEMSSAPWILSHTSMGFKWDESVINAVYPAPLEKPKKKKVDLSEPDAYIQQVTILVSTRQDSGTIQLAASVLHPTSGDTWNTAHEGADDRDGYGDKDGHFNSSVTVTAYKPYKPAATSPDFGNKEAGSPTRLARQPIAVAIISEDGKTWERISHQSDDPAWHQIPSERLYRFYESWVSIAYGGTQREIHSVTLGANTKKWSADGRGEENSEWCAIFITTAAKESSDYVVGQEGAYQLKHRIQPVYFKTLSECVTELVGGRTRYPGDGRVIIGILNGIDDNVFVDRDKTVLSDDRMQKIEIVDEFGTTHTAYVTIDDLRYASLS